MNRDYWPTTDWTKCEPEDVGMDSGLLLEADREIKSAMESVNSFLVVKHGAMAFESYYNGYGPEDAQRVNSVTKSFLSALIGIAIDKGLIEGIHQRVLSFFPEYAVRSTSYPWDELTLRHLLSMTSGIYWGARKMTEPMLGKLIRSSDWVDFIFSLPINEGPPAAFQYSSGNSHLLSAIIAKTSGMSAKDFANKFLFAPIGIPPLVHAPMFTLDIDPVYVAHIKESFWLTDPQGCNVGGFGLSLRPRDMARLGYLYLNYGVWDGEAIISRDWIVQSTTPCSGGNMHGRYGLHWWLGKLSGHPAYYAIGYGGQYIVNVPAKDLTVVFTCAPDYRIPGTQNPFLLLERYILPAIKKG